MRSVYCYLNLPPAMAWRDHTCWKLIALKVNVSVMNMLLREIQVTAINPIRDVVAEALEEEIYLSYRLTKSKNST